MNKELVKQFIDTWVQESLLAADKVEAQLLHSTAREAQLLLNYLELKEVKQGKHL